jgi:hypothetical protein
MIYLKMMSGENLQDSNTSKGFTLIPISSDEYLEMERFENNLPYIIVKQRGSNGGMECRMQGNAYVIEGNKTIASYAYSRH